MGIMTREEYVQQIVFLPPNHALVSPENSLSEKTVTQLERYLAEGAAAVLRAQAHGGTGLALLRRLLDAPWSAPVRAG